MARRKLLPVLVASLLWLSCLSDPFTGSTTVVDFLSDLAPSSTVRLDDGSTTHYQLWVQFEDFGVLSLGTFFVNSDLQIFSYPDVDNRIGSVTGADDLQRSGVRFVSQANLERATSAFVTLEADGETDVSPSGSVIMEGELTSQAQGELRGQMAGQYTNRLGQVLSPVARITIIIAEDHVYF